MVSSEAEPAGLQPPSIFPPEEESALVQESRTEKAFANNKFTAGDHSSAIQGYQKALAVCPTYLEYESAVLHANIAACHLKLSEWKQAVESATQALEALDRVDPPTHASDQAEDDVVEVDDATEVRIAALARTGKTTNDVCKLRTKALLRRAKGRREANNWTSLQGSLEDYRALSKPPHHLTSLDMKVVQSAQRELLLEVEKAKNAEVAEMMGKLKQLGNGLLKPFGLSTDNFQFTKDEGTGGYGMSFNQNAK